jgi:hypothetical protein
MTIENSSENTKMIKNETVENENTNPKSMSTSPRPKASLKLDLSFIFIYKKTINKRIVTKIKFIPIDI